MPRVISQNGIIVLELYPNPNDLIDPSSLYKKDGFIIKAIT